MARSVFVSYNHTQAEWMRDRLVPVLKAGGAEVLVDHERFTAGKGVLGQMDATQDAADIHLLVFSPEYLKSDYCFHEMDRAVASDPRFEKGVVVPIKRTDVRLPDLIRKGNPLYANLVDDSVVDSWNLVLGACEADLGASTPDWLAARDEVQRLMERGRSAEIKRSNSPRSSGSAGTGVVIPSSRRISATNPRRDTVVPLATFTSARSASAPRLKPATRWTATVRRS